MRILVTDGESRAALAITRSLGRAGHHVMVGERRRTSLAGSSRFCAGSIVYPDPAKDEARFVDELVAVTKAERIEALIPVTDITTLSVTAQRARFAPHTVIPGASAKAAHEAADKATLMKTAMRLGVPTPRTWFAESAESGLAMTDLPFPIVIKSYRSRVRTAQGWQSTSVRYARDRNELERELLGRAAYEYPLLLQEKINGPGMGVFMCYDRGKPVAVFSHRRLREKPPTGGISVLSESIAVDPVVQEYGERLLGAIGWHGVAMVEFKRDTSDGQPKLMEINGRFWGSLQLAIDAGVDFPAILLATVSANPAPVGAGYRVGVRSRWLWGDLDSLITRLRAGKELEAADGRRPLQAVLDFLAFWGKDLHYENPRLSDLRPWIHETMQRIRSVA